MATPISDKSRMTSALGVDPTQGRGADDDPTDQLAEDGRLADPWRKGAEQLGRAEHHDQRPQELRKLHPCSQVSMRRMGRGLGSV
jgi:hypothetical protein